LAWSLERQGSNHFEVLAVGGITHVPVPARRHWHLLAKAIFEELEGGFGRTGGEDETQPIALQPGATDGGVC